MLIKGIEVVFVKSAWLENQWDTDINYNRYQYVFLLLSNKTRSKGQERK